METPERDVKYLGPYKDTILLSRIEDWRTPIGDNTVPIDDSLNRHYPRYEDVDLKIIFDPSKQVTLEEYESSEKEKGYKYYKAYPIVITNETDSVTIVGYGFNVPVILEALDKDKTWKPVEMEYRYLCGNGLEYILLKPREMVCVLAPIYTGEFKTKLRYRLGNSLSKEFVGYISRDLFVYY